MSWRTRFLDDFDNGVVDVQTAPGGHSITEPAGTELEIVVSASLNAEWSNSNQVAPVAFENIADHEDGQEGLLRFETKVTGSVRTGVEISAGLVLWGHPTIVGVDRLYCYQGWWYDSNDNVYFNRLNTQLDWVTRWQGGNYGDPNTTPHIYRMYINRTNRRIQIAEVGQYLDSRQIGFQFSSNNGASWVWAYKETMPFLPTKFGVYVRNWSTSYRGATVKFDYLKFEQDNDPNFYIGDQEPYDQEQTQNSGQTEIETRSVTAHQNEGLRTTGRDGQVEIETEGAVASPGVLTGKHRAMLVPAAPSDGQTEVGVLGDLIDADYLQEKADGDGNDILAYGDVTGVEVIDTTAGSFGVPVSNNHWGAARDGRYYADGLICAPGDFGTVLGGFRKTAWRFSGQDPLGLADGTTIFSLVADDQLRIKGTWPLWGDPGGQVSSHLKWYLEPGDFDIQVDFLNYAVLAGSEGESRLAINANNENGTQQFYINRDASGNYRTARVLNGSYASLGTTGTGDTSGKLRITRVGGVLTAYKWNGSGWDQVGSTLNDSRLQGYVFVQMGSSGNNNTQTDITYSNFTINSGTTTNRVGWYREASGTHRGTQPDMPSSLAVVCTVSSVELIDRSMNKLWMRFLKVNNYALSNYSDHGQRPWRAAWSNGVLMIAEGSSPSQSAEGGAIWIDFTLDQIRIHRNTVSTICGGMFANSSNNPIGCIALRNSAFSYTGDYDEYGIPDYRTYDVDVLHLGLYEYIAAATLDGMAMFKRKRWYSLDPLGLENSYSIETDRMFWCHLDHTDGELFYMDAANMYSRNRTGMGQGWQDWMTGGIFTAQYSKTLPGTRLFDVQYHAAKSGAFLFVPANEGVYRVDWPSGSWTLFFGAPGSGATHEILPACQYVTALAVGSDGATTVLLVAVANQQRGQVIAIRLSDNTIYGRLEYVELKVPTVVAS